MGPECPGWRRCEAVSYPLDSERHLVVWYPDEGICHRAEYQGLPWIRIRRQIQRRARDRVPFYTLAMLEAMQRVHPGSRGVDVLPR